MNGNKALLDSNVIIYISKGQVDIERLLTQYDELLVSIITYMEVFGYNFDSEDEKALLDNFFQLVEIVNINEYIAEKVIEYRKNRYKKIKIPDAIILATTRLVGADLISDDWDDFAKIDNLVKIVPVAELKA